MADTFVRQDLEALRAESLRLRQEFLTRELDLSDTLAAFADLPRSDELKLRSRDAAWKGYHTVQRLVRPELPQDFLMEVRARSGQLRASLEQEHPDDEFDVQLLPTSTPSETPAVDLTRREREVLSCIVRGQSTKEAAATLGITFKTAACHRYHIMTKLDIHDTASLVCYAIRNRIVRT